MDPTSQNVVTLRGDKNPVSETEPYAFLHEREPVSGGGIENFATVFLTNRECPFRCTMCDLWKNTLDEKIAIGAIPNQIETALQRLPPAENIKLYNSGNFFDPNAIPREDLSAIAEIVAPFHRLVVENHPRLTDQRCVDFRSRIDCELEIAIGLETIHADTLKSLNKQMTVDDFSRTVEFLLANNISVRAFVLLKPPGMSEQQGIEWAIKSVEFAFSIGVECCSVIPVRAGNGYVDELIRNGASIEPKLRSLEQVHAETLLHKRGRVFADLWDAKRFSDCDSCFDRRSSRLNEMNLSQTVLPTVACEKCGTS